MEITLNINQQDFPLNVPASERLLDTLRKLGFFSIKSGGCEKGECGACAVLLDGRPVNSCTMLTAQAQGHSIETVEAIGEHPQHGWKKSEGLHVIQEAFVDTGAIQCGYCTPAMVMVAKALLERNPDPTQEEVREALSGVLCRCTGYLKPVQAVLRAAAILRGEDVSPIDEPVDISDALDFSKDDEPSGEPMTSGGGTLTETHVFPKLKVVDSRSPMKSVGHGEPKVDAIKLVQGKPAFTADFEKRDLLVAKVLRSPHAHAIIKNIDV
ncbi:MAG: 2Fe-2S iron-sulfur cluster-binding protein, partial [Brevefilum sp.]